MIAESTCLVLHAGQAKLVLQPCKTHGSDVIPIEIILNTGCKRSVVSHICTSYSDILTIIYIRMIIGSNRVSIFFLNFASACNRCSCDMDATSGGGTSLPL